MADLDIERVVDAAVTARVEAPPCPEAARHHSDEPDGYIQWHPWAERMSTTHIQRRCPGCGLWKIWEAR